MKFSIPPISRAEDDASRAGVIALGVSSPVAFRIRALSSMSGVWEVTLHESWIDAAVASSAFCAPASEGTSMHSESESNAINERDGRSASDYMIPSITGGRFDLKLDKYEHGTEGIDGDNGMDEGF